jgi:hypothetical protein
LDTPQDKSRRAIDGPRLDRRGPSLPRPPARRALLAGFVIAFGFGAACWFYPGVPSRAPRAIAPQPIATTGSTYLHPAIAGPTIASGDLAPAGDWDETLREMRHSAAGDLDSALGWAQSQADPERREQALETVCFAVAADDPARAVQLAQTFHLEQRPGNILENLVQLWAEVDFMPALNWAIRQPANEARDHYLTRVALVCAKAVPLEAARLVTEKISAGPAQTEAVVIVVHQWANQDLTAAATWVGYFPDGPLRDRAIGELTGAAIERRSMVSAQ